MFYIHLLINSFVYVCVCMNACSNNCIKARTQLLGLFSLILRVPEIVFVSLGSVKKSFTGSFSLQAPQDNLNYWPIISQKGYLSNTSLNQWWMEHVLVSLNSPVNFWLHALHGLIQFSIKLISRMLLILKTHLLSFCHLCLFLNFINVS